MKKLILLFLALYFVSCKPKDQSFEGDNKIDIVSFQKLPIVEVDLNGKPAYFILDTGGSISVLDENQEKDYGFFVEDDDQEAAGYGGVGKFKKALLVNLVLGGVRFDTDYKAQDLSAIVRAMKNGEGIKITGIIGSDIMKPNAFILNFSDHTVSLGK